MTRYVVILASPSLGLMGMSDYYFKAYGVEADTPKILSSYIDDILRRNFALEYNVSLDSVEMLFVSKIKDKDK